MKQQVWVEKYKIASYLVNIQGRAGLYAILNLIQDVGWLHAVHLEVKLPKNLGWVFTRQKLIMHEWPAWNETVILKTWLRPPASDSFLFRDYEILIGEKKIGECTSTFAVMDMSTRKLAPQDWAQFPTIWNTDHQSHQAAEKIQAAEEVEELAQFQVRNSDIDLNQHVNNTKYAQWILDSIPIDIIKNSGRLHSYEVNFLAETKSGDQVNVQKSKHDMVEGDLSVTQFQGLRAKDNKLVFTAKLKVQN